MPGNLAIGCNIIDTLIARLSTAGELLTDPTADRAGRDHQLARLLTAFPFVSQAPDWLSFLSAYGGLTYVRGQFSSGFFGLSYSASLHILDGEGDPVDNGYLLFCDADPAVALPDGPAGYVGFAFDATGTRPWGVHGVTIDGDGHWFAPTFTEWLVRFVDAVT